MVCEFASCSALKCTYRAVEDPGKAIYAKYYYGKLGSSPL